MTNQNQVPRLPCPVRAECDELTREQLTAIEAFEPPRHRYDGHGNRTQDNGGTYTASNYMSNPARKGPTFNAAGNIPLQVC